MIKGLINFWQMFRGTIRGFDTSKQLAMGVTLGMFIGMIPKDSLLSYSFGCLLLLSTANLLTGSISAFCFTWIAALFDPLSHRLGAMVLTFDMFEPTFSWLGSQPVIPWTRFENTVVTGSLVLALLLAIPVYRVSLFGMDRYGKLFSDTITQSRLGRWILAIPPETEPKQS